MPCVVSPLLDRASITKQWCMYQHYSLFSPASMGGEPSFAGRFLPSFSPPHRKNDQKSYRGAKLTTGQTIASTSPVQIKKSSPIAKKILSQNRTHFPKNPSHLDLNRPLPPAKRAHLLQVLQLLQVKQVKQKVSDVLKRIELRPLPRRPQHCLDLRCAADRPGIALYRATL